MSVERNVRGSGAVVFRVRWREHGRNRARTFTTRRDADAWDREVKRRQQLGPIAVAQLTAKGPSLGEWIAERWAPEHGATLAPRTRERYAESYARHALDELDHLPLRDLTVGRMRAWQAGLMKAGVSPSEVTKARTFMSSVLRHAAESEAIPGNPITLVRAPKAEQRDEVEPLAPVRIEAVRAQIANPMPKRVERGTRSGSPRAAYDMPDPRDASTRCRDATLVAVLAYAGLRPAEALGLRWSDIRDRTVLVQRTVDADGSIRPTKGRRSRSVRLLAPLRQDIAEHRMAAGRPAATALVFPRADGAGWTRDDLGNWRSRAWRTACSRAGLEPVPRPYDLRHSFASLLLAEHRTIHYVAKQLGHAPALTLRDYGHVIAEFEDADRIDAEGEIRGARGGSGTRSVPATESRSRG